MYAPKWRALKPKPMYRPPMPFLDMMVPPILKNSATPDAHSPTEKGCF